MNDIKLQCYVFIYHTQICNRKSYIIQLKTFEFFHTIIRFPKDNQTLAAWMEFAKQCSSEVKARSVVCSAYFTKDCFDHFYRSVQLKKNSIPPIFIQRVKSVRKNNHIFCS